jgi:hypothetical protein
VEPDRKELQNLIGTPCLLSENLKTEMYQTIILRVALILREQHRLRIMEKRVLRRFGLKRQKIT